MPPHQERLFALERGRAIWIPEHYSDLPIYTGDEKYRLRQRSLGCYHRNLTMAVLQTRGLINLVRRSNEFLSDKSQISFLISNPVKKSAEMLNKLYLGDEETYRSWSVKHHISYNLEMIKQVCEAVGVEWLEASAGPEDEDWPENDDWPEDDEDSDMPF